MLGAREPHVLAQDLEQRLVRRERDLVALAVDAQGHVDLLQPCTGPRAGDAPIGARPALVAHRTSPPTIRSANVSAISAGRRGPSGLHQTTVELRAPSMESVASFASTGRNAPDATPPSTTPAHERARRRRVPARSRARRFPGSARNSRCAALPPVSSSRHRTCARAIARSRSGGDATARTIRRAPREQRGERGLLADVEEVFLALEVVVEVRRAHAEGASRCRAWRRRGSPAPGTPRRRWRRICARRASRGTGPARLRSV